MVASSVTEPEMLLQVIRIVTVDSMERTGMTPDNGIWLRDPPHHVALLDSQ
jgi:hypothetical protein